MIEKIYIWILSGLLGVINLLFWSRIKRIEADIKENKNKNERIEKNYIARFEEIHAKLNEVEKNIIKELYNFKLLAISRQQSEGSPHKADERTDRINN